MLLPKILFIISGTLWGIELLPQIIRTYKKKKVGDISVLYPFIGTLAFLSFLSASLLEKNWILLFTHIFPFICIIVFLFQMLIYRKKKKERKIKCYLCHCRAGYENKIASEREWLCECSCHKGK